MESDIFYLLSAAGRAARPRALWRARPSRRHSGGPRPFAACSRRVFHHVSLKDATFLMIFLLADKSGHYLLVIKHSRLLTPHAQEHAHAPPRPHSGRNLPWHPRRQRAAHREQASLSATSSVTPLPPPPPSLPRSPSSPPSIFFHINLDKANALAVISGSGHLDYANERQIGGVFF